MTKSIKMITYTRNFTFAAAALAAAAGVAPAAAEPEELPDNFVDPFSTEDYDCVYVNSAGKSKLEGVDWDKYRREMMEVMIGKTNSDGSRQK